MAIPAVRAVAHDANVSNNSVTQSPLVPLAVGAEPSRVAWAICAIMDTLGSSSTVGTVVFDPGGANEANFEFVTALGNTVNIVQRYELWRLVNPPNVTADCQATIAGAETVNNLGLIVFYTDNTDQTNQVGETDTNNNSGVADVNWGAPQGAGGVWENLRITTAHDDSRVIVFGGTRGLVTHSHASLTEHADFQLDGPGARDISTALYSTGVASASTAVEGDVAISANQNFAALIVEIRAAAGGGGAALLAIRNETEEAAESFARRMSLTRAQSEGVEAAEAFARLMALNRMQAEDVESSETFASLRGLIRAQAETVESSEESAFFRGLLRTVDETIEIAESTAFFRGLLREFSETLEISEDALHRLGLIRRHGETIEVSEALIRLMALVRRRNETVEITTAFARIHAMVRIRDESEQVSESARRLHGMIRVAAEDVSIGETHRALKGLVRIANETVNVVESTLNLAAAAALGLLIAGISVVGAIAGSIRTRGALEGDVESEGALEGRAKANDED